MIQKEPLRIMRTKTAGEVTRSYSDELDVRVRYFDTEAAITP